MEKGALRSGVVAGTASNAADKLSELACRRIVEASEEG